MAVDQTFVRRARHREPWPVETDLAATSLMVKPPAYTGGFTLGAGIDGLGVAEEGFEPPTKGL